MPRSLDQILAEVTSKSDPQRQLVLGQISQLPTQQAADESALDAKKTQAYDEILGGARQRGLGFSGIPLAEQAKYNATDYAPALANLKTNYGGRQATLESALADIGKNDYTTANDIFNQDRTFEEQQRQFNEQQRTAAAQGGAFAGLFNQPSQPQQTQADPLKQKAVADITHVFNSGRGQDSILQEISAIKKSAGYGNTYDQLKLQLIQALHPEYLIARPVAPSGTALPRLAQGSAPNGINMANNALSALGIR